MTALHVGTSGFSYKEWKGAFYPAELPVQSFLHYYAERFPVVEINNTFYRMPKRELLTKWKGDVPPGFVFVLKAPQRITHQKRLDDIGDDVRFFLDAASELGAQLGPLLFQLPPYLRKNAEKLHGLLQLVPQRYRVAIEFRHASWHDDEIYALLRERGAALCCADTDDAEEATPLVQTASWAYLRLRRPGYEPAALKKWLARVRPFSEAFVFFKHEEAGGGPLLATELLALAQS